MHVYFGELAVIFQVHLKDMRTVVAQEGRVGCLSTERLRVPTTGSSILHVEVSLRKMLNPEMPLMRPSQCESMNIRLKRGKTLI